MMRWPWVKRPNAHADALDAIERGERALEVELEQGRRADQVVDRDRAVGRRNHFAETWAAALDTRQRRVGGS